QQNAERIDVAGGGDRLSPDLFRTRIVRRHRAQAGHCRRESLRVKLRLQQLGNAEVQQLRHAFRGDENVARLEVAMDDEVLMRVVHRAADHAKQLQALGGCKFARLAVLVYGLALDVFHDEVWQAVGGRAAVEQAGDVRMIEAGKDLAFVAKA